VKEGERDASKHSMNVNQDVKGDIGEHRSAQVKVEAKEFPHHPVDIDDVRVDAHLQWRKELMQPTPSGHQGSWYFQMRRIKSESKPPPSSSLLSEMLESVKEMAVESAQSRRIRKLAKELEERRKVCLSPVCT
jgi:hypothetical protein